MKKSFFLITLFVLIITTNAQNNVYYYSFKITDSLGAPMPGWRFKIISNGITRSVSDKDGIVDFVFRDGAIDYDNAEFQFTVACESKQILLKDIKPFETNVVDGFMVVLTEYKVYQDSNIPRHIKMHHNIYDKKSKSYAKRLSKKWREASKPVKENYEYYKKYINNCDEPFAIDVE